MKRYIIGLFLILLIAGCQQQATPTAPEPTGQVVADEPRTPTTEEKTTEGVKEEAKEGAPEGADVSILGKGGFDPAELTVKKGTLVVFMNNDPKSKDALLTFQVGRKFINSDIIKPGEKYEQLFDEEGTYEYWTIGYGVKGKVIVE